jgi:hypothetical protein
MRIAGFFIAAEPAPNKGGNNRHNNRLSSVMAYCSHCQARCHYAFGVPHVRFSPVVDPSRAGKEKFSGMDSFIDEIIVSARLTIPQRTRVSQEWPPAYGRTFLSCTS